MLFRSGLLLTITMCCVLAEMSVWQGQNLPAGAGGVLGHWLLSVLLPLFSFVGTAVVVSASVALGLMLYLEFSWLHLFERLGGWVIRYIKKDRSTAKLAKQKVANEKPNNSTPNKTIAREFEFTALSDPIFSAEDEELNNAYDYADEPWLTEIGRASCRERV